MAKNITTSEAFWFGFMLLGQVTGILLTTAILGWLLDEFAGTRPFGLAGAVLIGSVVATITVLTKVMRELR